MHRLFFPLKALLKFVKTSLYACEFNHQCWLFGCTDYSYLITDGLETPDSHFLMSDRSFAAMGEKCGIASPPDTSVSSTSCVDSHLAPHPAGLTALTEDLALLDLCMPSLIKQPCDTEEGEVTSSSEIVSAFWNNFPTPLDSVYNEVLYCEPNYAVHSN